MSAEITSFSDFFIHDRIEKALDNLRLKVPTDVQKASIPHALDGKDLQVCAETGSGKTLAYLLPMMQKFLQSKSTIQGTRGLILVPTRELARQVFKAAKQLTDFNGMSVGLLTGGDDFKFQAAMLRKNPEFIVSTPGRLVDHIKRRSTDMVDLEVLVLDEADRMLDMGFAEDMEIISGECNEGNRQTLLFSATLHHKGIARVAAKVLDDPMEITTATVRDKHDNIKQQVILADDGAHKDRLLSWLLSNDDFEKAIIFTNTRTESERLNVFLRQHSCRCAVLHGELSQDQRNATMQLFREGKINVNGVVVPAYGLNSLLGKIPLVGGLFSGGSGKGLFGVAYRVKGMTENPDVDVNALSGLAPGFLRLLFEGKKGKVADVEIVDPHVAPFSSVAPLPDTPSEPETHSGPEDVEPAEEAGPAETDPTETAPAETAPAETDPAETDPAETDPAGGRS